VAYLFGMSMVEMRQVTLAELTAMVAVLHQANTKR
jgi:hypothetical protein